MHFTMIRLDWLLLRRKRLVLAACVLVAAVALPFALRQSDHLSAGGFGQTSNSLFLVAPDKREAEVRAQLERPAFRRDAMFSVLFLPYSALEKHRHEMARFGQSVKAVEAAARRLT